MQVSEGVYLLTFIEYLVESSEIKLFILYNKNAQIARIFLKVSAIPSPCARERPPLPARVAYAWTAEAAFFFFFAPRWENIEDGGQSETKRCHTSHRSALLLNPKSCAVALRKSQILEFGLMFGENGA